jgi:hypothetical protein
MNSKIVAGTIVQAVKAKPIALNDCVDALPSRSKIRKVTGFSFHPILNGLFGHVPSG